ncbi:hypothetical protein K1719_006079 [Acacia pycnantha]|nr:hypothetical protein K1719_006079 [Acacia pycnantha]
MRHRRTINSEWRILSKITTLAGKLEHRLSPVKFRKKKVTEKFKNSLDKWKLKESLDLMEENELKVQRCESVLFRCAADLKLKACFEASAEDHKCQASQDQSVRPQVLIVASSASKEKTQLRNLVWATSKHDVYLISNYSVMHWSSLTGNLSEIINFSGHVAPTEE